MIRFIALGSLLLFLGCLVAVVLFPQIDLAVSSLFVKEGGSFYLRHSVVLNGISDFAFYFARGAALFFAVAAIVAAVRKRAFVGLRAKAWVFLLLGILIGPGLIANVILKDNWGRARPRDVVELGGKKLFTPALAMSDQCKRNCSFVSGDGAFGFFLPSFAYVVPLRRRRRVFAGTMGLAFILAGARIVIGAHFFSDVLYAALFTMAACAGIHAALFGKAQTKEFWRSLFVRPRQIVS